MLDSDGGLAVPTFVKTRRRVVACDICVSGSTTNLHGWIDCEGHVLGHNESAVRSESR